MKLLLALSLLFHSLLSGGSGNMFQFTGTSCSLTGTDFRCDYVSENLDTLLLDGSGNPLPLSQLTGVVWNGADASYLMTFTVLKNGRGSGFGWRGYVNSDPTTTFSIWYQNGLWSATLSLGSGNLGYSTGNSEAPNYTLHEFIEP